MMNIKQTFPILFALVLLAACSGGGEQAEGSAEHSRANEMADRISALEDSVSHHVGVDRRSAQTLLDVYKGYASAFPLDERSPGYLFRAARVALAMRDPGQSLRIYDRIIVDYPSWEELPSVHFMRGFIYDDQLQQKGEAKTAYQHIIYNYPDHPLAEQARVAIDNLQYTDEELIERFKRMQAEQEAAAN
jgi:tetratricopeptide (TPR) repeat protein